jgi:hypothetical protein
MKIGLGSQRLHGCYCVSIPVFVDSVSVCLCLYCTHSQPITSCDCSLCIWLFLVHKLYDYSTILLNNLKSAIITRSAFRTFVPDTNTYRGILVSNSRNIGKEKSSRTKSCGSSTWWWKLHVYILWFFCFGYSMVIFSSAHQRLSRRHSPAAIQRCYVIQKFMYSCMSQQ